jgi:hypothetical protein
MQRRRPKPWNFLQRTSLMKKAKIKPDHQREIARLQSSTIEERLLI